MDAGLHGNSSQKSFFNLACSNRTVARWNFIPFQFSPIRSSSTKNCENNLLGRERTENRSRTFMRRQKIEDLSNLTKDLSHSLNIRVFKYYNKY